MDFSVVPFESAVQSCAWLYCAMTNMDKSKNTQKKYGRLLKKANETITKFIETSTSKISIPCDKSMVMVRVMTKLLFKAPMDDIQRDIASFNERMSEYMDMCLAGDISMYKDVFEFEGADVLLNEITDAFMVAYTISKKPEMALEMSIFKEKVQCIISEVTDYITRDVNVSEKDKEIMIDYVYYNSFGCAIIGMSVESATSYLINVIAEKVIEIETQFVVASNKDSNLVCV